MTEFQEIQKFTQWWLWALLLGGGVVLLWALFQSGTPNESINSTSIWIVVIVLSFVVVLFSVLTLKTEVTAEGIQIRHFPLWSTFIPWHEIESAEIITYGFVGYGIRLSFRYGTVYNIKGDVGLQIVKKNGSKVLLGTQRPEDLEAVVRKYLLLKG
ncbi:hypothetical protein [Persicitalea sp.]|uniref:hypothetical protein n=1 Tax=Persicitalea sp. TaxID=3100273 RepID=UPI003593DFA9